MSEKKQIPKWVNKTYLLIFGVLLITLIGGQIFSDEMVCHIQGDVSHCYPSTIFNYLPFLLLLGGVALTIYSLIIGIISSIKKQSSRIWSYSIIGVIVSLLGLGYYTISYPYVSTIIKTLILLCYSLGIMLAIKYLK